MPKKKTPPKKKTAARQQGATARRRAAKPPARGLKPASRAERSFSRPLVSPAPKGSWHFPERKPGDRWYWLLKQEPTDFGFDDLWAGTGRTTNWEGVRNFVARTFLREHIKPGDHAFFYHSNAEPSAVVGIVEIVRGGYPDETAFDRKSPYFDADSSRENPKWFQVDVRAVDKLPRPVSLAEIKAIPELASLVLLHISQLSVQPVTPREWELIVCAAGR